MRQAAFLDLNGTLVEPLKPERPDQLVLMPDVVGSVARLTAAGFICPVVTVQSRIAKGLFTLEEFEVWFSGFAADLALGGAIVVGPYRYRGTDPQHHENVGLRLAMQRQVPLIYFHGIVPGLYVAEWPIYIVADDPYGLTFTVSVDDRRFASLGSVAQLDTEETEIRRRYATRLFQQRLHQREFRERVVRAYQHHCAVCSLRRDELLEAAHIVADADPFGVPRVPNGLALCTLHHAAFDSHLIGIRPDYVVQVREDVLDDEDGPMLIHGLQGFHGARLHVPRQATAQPDRQLRSDMHFSDDSLAEVVLL